MPVRLGSVPSAERTRIFPSSVSVVHEGTTEIEAKPSLSDTESGVSTTLFVAAFGDGAACVLGATGSLTVGSGHLGSVGDDARPCRFFFGFSALLAMLRASVEMTAVVVV